ncbi:MAG TPA: hypothetical protein VNR38_00950 [Ureibacillus sp.]|nr:hypothetical protein [Ureibacillus sp.]
MLKKEEVFVRVSSEKKARKLAKLLEMFGEGVYKPTLKRLKNGVVSDEYPIVHYNWEWNGIGSSPIDKTKVSIKELRNILAVEHLKSGDVVVLNNGEIVKIKHIGDVWFEELNGLFHASDFIRYANEEEKALLEPVSLTEKDYKDNTWYKSNRTGNLFFLDKISSYHYGFNSCCYSDDIRWFECFKENGFDIATNWTEATPQEVEEALIKEVKRRYKVGDLLRDEDGDTKRFGLFTLRYRHEFNTLFQAGINIFKDGKWAEVIKPGKSLEERVKELEQKVEQLENR